jgi:hypothetical protein
MLVGIFDVFFFEREEVFLSKRGFVGSIYEMNIVRIKCLSFYFTRSRIDDEPTARDEEFFRDLSEIRQMRAMEYLVSGDITIDTIHSDVGWYHFEEVCHEGNEGFIIIGSETTISPYFCEFTFIGHHHRIYLEFVWTVGRIIKNFLK